MKRTLITMLLMTLLSIIGLKRPGRRHQRCA